MKVFVLGAVVAVVILLSSLPGFASANTGFEE
jgi:hypothetical protein